MGHEGADGELSDSDLAESAWAISDFLRLRGPHVLPPREVERLRAWLVDLFYRGGTLPARGRGFRWNVIAERCDIDLGRLRAGRRVLAPVFHALHRALRARRGRPVPPPPDPPASLPPRPDGLGSARLRSGPPADGAPFREVLAREMARRGETGASLARTLRAMGCGVGAKAIRRWALGLASPSAPASRAAVAGLERHWGLEAGGLLSRLPRPYRTLTGLAPARLGGQERALMAWHLPDDFDRRPKAEQDEIVTWIRDVVVRGATDYRRFLSAAQIRRFGVRFPELRGVQRTSPQARARDRRFSNTVLAPPALAAEMAALVAFKTSPLTAPSLQRATAWNRHTAGLSVEHLSVVFGALVAAPDSPVAGAGVDPEALGLGLLVFPAVWDWYLEWRRRRRGFFTTWEVSLLGLAASLAAPEAGWIAQSPGLSARLAPVPGLVGAEEVEAARADWAGACGRFHRYAAGRQRDLRRLRQVHHDRFEAVRVVLEADSPVGVYARIAEEALARRPNRRADPRRAAEATRDFLMIRLGLHLGFRQRNLRELLVCPRGAALSSELRLERLGRGELRWNDRRQGWEVFAPACAFKNAGSSFFEGRPFELRLSDVGGLYAQIEAWLDQDRAVLLDGRDDPGTFFVRRPRGRQSAAFGQGAFYVAWRTIIQRHGIYNPYTGRGAVAGLLPHGPHNVRDVVATHVLKQTGSYRQASYAIQDAPRTIAEHYGRYMPLDKTRIAAEVLDRVWTAT
ncbi:MAG: hypothetical protein GC203_11645 [Phenylobacterium sp.]|uniref:hypothetical protein n=1 Tax=Phenylobacterium sp. TaxID=1871053 RepID=UPI0025E03D40|nr:hypothetical protein [Phenylobacterium sp.]MBI1198506.1 hypothetical protein [Phenylobacterium sp.]